MAGVMQTLENVRDLPALPESLVRIPPMLMSGEYDTSALRDLIRRDEALVASVLKRANSVQFNASGDVFDLEQSIVRLGSKELMRLVTSAGANELLSEAGSCYGLNRGHLARSAVGGATVASALAKQAGGANPDLAYTCSLLRDIGKLVMDVHLDKAGEPIDQLLENAGGEPMCFLKLECDRYGADHAPSASSSDNRSPVQTTL